MAVPDQLQKGFTYADGDVVNAAGLNALVDQAEVLKGAIGEQTGVSADPADYVLITDTSASGALKKALVSTLPGVGTVTSVDFDATPASVFNDTVTHPTGAVEIVLELAPQQLNRVLAAPTDGSLATPSFRALVPADMPFATSAIAAAEIDWELGVMFTKTLTASPTAFTFIHPSAGQTIRVLVTQKTFPPGSACTVTWPASVLWPAGTNPVMSNGSGERDLYTFHYILGNYWGTFEQDFRL